MLHLLPLLLLVLQFAPSRSFLPPSPPRPPSSLPALKVRILTVGKKLASSSWLSPAYSQYSARLLPAGVSLETVLHKSDAALLASVAAAAGPVVLLSEEGEQLDSEAFGELLYGGLEEGGSRLAFVIGGADGLPPELRGSGRRKISLSRMTFTHQFARVMLAEQIYRASEIRKGSNYHK